MRRHISHFKAFLNFCSSSFSLDFIHIELLCCLHSFVLKVEIVLNMLHFNFVLFHSFVR